MLIKQLVSIAIAIVVINLWEETVWVGFFQGLALLVVLGVAVRP